MVFGGVVRLYWAGATVKTFDKVIFFGGFARVCLFFFNKVLGSGSCATVFLGGNWLGFEVW